MKHTIWKFPFDPNDEFTIEMPANSKIIYVDTQFEMPCMWVIVDSDLTYEHRDFVLRGTGHPFDGTEGAHIGSFQMMNGRLVWHVFEKKIE